MGTSYVSMDILGGNNQHRETNFSREHSFEEEGGQFMGEALVLKCASCSVGNFAAKFLNVVFKPEELVNRNCTGTRGKMALDPGKMALIKKYVFKFYPCAPANDESTWRKCVVAIDEFLRRKKRDGRATRLTKVYYTLLLCALKSVLPASRRHCHGQNVCDQY